MKKIILLIIINFAFSQTVDELRIMREKAFDLLAKSKNATHDVQRGNLHGVPISQEQKQAFLAKADSLDNEVVKLLTGTVDSELVINVEALSLTQQFIDTVPIRTYSGAEADVLSDLEQLKSFIENGSKDSIKGALVVIDKLYVPDLYYTSTRSGHIVRAETLTHIESIKQALGG